MRVWYVCLFLFAAAHASPAAAQVFDLDPVWYRFADPGGASPDDPTLAVPFPGDGYEDNRGWLSGESAEFSSDGQLILTASRGDGTFDGFPPYPTPELTGGTAHLRLWTVGGELLWDRARSRGPDLDGDGRPDDQVADGADEIEVAIWSAHPSNRDRYALAGGEDDIIEVWEVKDAAGALLAEPVLRRTLTMPAGRREAVDEMTFSTSGELLLAGTEYRTGIEIWRATGDVSTWEHVGSANGGGTGRQAINAAGFSSDDRHLVTAGGDTQGRLWQVNTTRDASGRVTAVDLATLAVMDGPVRSAKAAQFEPGTDRHVVLASKDQRMFVYSVDRLKAGDDTPVTVLSNSVYRGSRAMVGVEIEPGAYSRSGRFLVNGGGPRKEFPATTAGYVSSFFRVYETAEIRDGAPEPDPVWVQPAFATEHFDFDADDGLLTTVHEDGTVRLWTVNAGAAVTVASEGFNERTSAHDRWTLSGPFSTSAGDNEWGVTTQPTQAEINNADPGVEAVGQDVTQDAEWVGHRGSRYLGTDNLQGQLHALTMNDAWDAAGYAGLQVQFAVAAAPGAFEGDDVLRLLADLDGDGAFETTLAAFTPDGAGDLAWDGRKATAIFQDHVVDLEAALPAGFDGRVRFRVEARTDGGAEELAFDSLRLIGTPDGVGGGPTTTAVVVRARGKAGSERMELRIAGEAVRTWTVGTEFGDYALEVSGDVAASDVSVAFVNDQQRVRDLRVDRVTVGGAVYESEAPETFSTGTWSRGSGCAGGYKASEWLHCDGAFSYDQAASAAPPVRASSEGDGPAPLSVHPNPSAGRATVAFALEAAADARVGVYDVLGRRVAVLAEGRLGPGPHRLALEAGALPAGLYLVRLVADGRVEARPFTVAR